MKTIMKLMIASGIIAAIMAPMIVTAQGQPAPQRPARQRDQSMRQQFPGRAGNVGGGMGIVESMFAPAPPQEIERISDQLKLTDDQKRTIGDLAKEKMDAIRPLMEQQPPLHKQIADIMLSNSPDAAKAKGLIEKIQAIRTKVAGIGIDFWTAVRAELTADQNTQLTELLRARMMRGQRRMGGYGPGADGPWMPGGPGPNGPGNPPPGGPPQPDPGQ